MRQAGLSLLQGMALGARRYPRERPFGRVARPVQRSAAIADDLGERCAMTDYDPRTATGIPTEPVGSLPRPSSLQRAYAQYDAGDITPHPLEAEQDAPVRAPLPPL